MRPHLIALLLASGSLRAQQPTAAPPPIRPIGPIEHVTKDSLLSVTSAVPTSAGRVFVNDILGRRVILYDSTLSTYRVVVDSTGPNAYTGQLGAMISYRGDSALFISPEALAMTVLTPSGSVGRVMATPTLPRGMFGVFFNSAGFDAQGRIFFYLPLRVTFPRSVADANAPIVIQPPDSSMLMRFDLAARKLDTVAYFKVGGARNTSNRKDGITVSIAISYNPLTVLDDWVVDADGSLAVLRGRDYHVDWMTPDDKWTSTPRMAFAWEHFTEGQKRHLLDSGVAAQQRFMDSLRDARLAALQQRGENAGPGRGSPAPIRNLFTPVELNELSDYRPPVRGMGSMRADLDGNLWIRTSVIVDKRPVYDVVSRQGVVVDRVMLPLNRFIAGFGHGVVYMSVLDSLKVAHLERARVR